MIIVVRIELKEVECVELWCYYVKKRIFVLRVGEGFFVGIGGFVVDMIW